MLIIVILVGSVFSILVYLNGFYIKSINELNHREIRTLEELEKDEYFLYLRSFCEDNFTDQVTPVNVFLPLGTSKFRQDERLIGQLGNDKIIVKVNNQSDKNMKVGASIIKVGSAWKESVYSLMQHSNKIIFNPNDSEGLLWEFNAIVDNKLLSKTIFLNSFGQSDLKRVSKIKRKYFFTLLQNKYGIQNIMRSRNEKYFIIEDNHVFFWDDIHKAIDYLDGKRSKYN